MSEQLMTSKEKDYDIRTRETEERKATLPLCRRGDPPSERRGSWSNCSCGDG